MTVLMRISHAPEPAFHARSIHGCPMVIGDEMPPTQSMADGKFYTSKAAIRATYLPSGNPNGHRYAEVGNDPAIHRPFKRPKPDRKAIKDAVGRAFARAGISE